MRLVGMNKQFSRLLIEQRLNQFNYEVKKQKLRQYHQ